MTQRLIGVRLQIWHNPDWELRELLSEKIRLKLLIHIYDKMDDSLDYITHMQEQKIQEADTILWERLIQ